MDRYGLTSPLSDLVTESVCFRTASTDETVQIHPFPVPTQASKTSSGSRSIPPITHSAAFRAVLPLPLHPLLDDSTFPYLIAASGDNIRTYDISSLRIPSFLSEDEKTDGGLSGSRDPGSAEFIREIEGHWHDVTGLGVWLKETNLKEGRGKEVWIVSASVDLTIRRWRLAGEFFSLVFLIRSSS